MSTTTPQTSIHLRMLPAQWTLIDRASKVLGKTHAEFVLEAACREAENVLLEQHLLALDDETYATFTSTLSTPVKENPALRRLLKIPAPWE